MKWGWSSLLTQSLLQIRRAQMHPDELLLGDRLDQMVDKHSHEKD